MRTIVKSHADVSVLKNYADRVGLFRMTIDPEMAAAMLCFNFGNRRIRPHRVAVYAKDHERDKFDGSAVHIRFDKNGNLINGQHTLTMIVMTGKALHNVLVEFGCDPDVMKYLDRGLPRNVSDALTFLGASNVTLLSTALRSYIAYRNYGDKVWTGQAMQVTESDMVTEYEARPDFWNDIGRIAVRMRHSKVNSPGLYGTLAALTDGLDTATFSAFEEGISVGANLSKGDPRLTLRNSSHDTRFTKEATTQHRFIYITIAWNKWISGESMNQLKYSYKPIPMPEPIRVAPEASA